MNWRSEGRSKSHAKLQRQEGPSNDRITTKAHEAHQTERGEQPPSIDQAVATQLPSSRQATAKPAWGLAVARHTGKKRTTSTSFPTRPPSYQRSALWGWSGGMRGAIESAHPKGKGMLNSCPNFFRFLQISNHRLAPANSAGPYHPQASLTVP